MRTRIALLLYMLAAPGLHFAVSGGQQPPTNAPQVKPDQKMKYARGRVAPSPAKLAEMKARSNALHGHKLRALPRITASSFDCRAMGWAPPVLNQGQCGSCWCFSGCETATGAFIKAGWTQFKTTDLTTTLSPQFVLDCGQNGGCNGDDNTTVLIQCKATGLPTTAAYGPYQAQAGTCKSATGMTLYQVQDWGFCDGTGNGVTATQTIKDCMVAKGCIGCAVAAGGTDFWNTGAGTDTGTSSSIDHDVLLVGWDDNHDNGDGSKGAWIMQNSWDVTWGTNGCAWMKYGADSIGTEAVWATAPPAPAPAAAPIITSALTATGAVGTPFIYAVTTTDAPTAIGAANLPSGLTYNVTTNVITGTPTIAGSFPITLSAGNAAGASTATLNLTITGGPTPPGPIPPVPGTTTITLSYTPDQVASMLSQLGAVRITRDMPLGVLLDEFTKCMPGQHLPSAPQGTDAALDKRLKVIEDALGALLKAELMRQKRESQEPPQMPKKTSKKDGIMPLSVSFFSNGGSGHVPDFDRRPVRPGDVLASPRSVAARPDTAA